MRVVIIIVIICKYHWYYQHKCASAVVWSPAILQHSSTLPSQATIMAKCHILFSQILTGGLSSPLLGSCHSNTCLLLRLCRRHPIKSLLLNNIELFPWFINNEWIYLADTNKRKVNIDRLNKQPIVEAVVISSNIYDYLLETMVVQVAAEPASRRCQEVAINNVTGQCLQTIHTCNLTSYLYQSLPVSIFCQV